MPYLDSQIKPEDHEPKCPNPKAMGLYRRGYNKKGNRTSILRALECPSCGVIIKLPYKHNPTKRQRDKLMSMPKLPKILSEKENFQIKSKEEIERDFWKWTKDRKIRKIQGRVAKNAKLSRKEKQYRQKVRALKTMYKNDEKDCPRLKGKVNWDPNLVEKFLGVRPTYYEILELLYWPPLRRDNNKWANKYRGYIPYFDEKPENFGYIGRDPDYFNLKNKPVILHDPNKLTRFEKVVIEEAQGRMDYMQIVIRKYHASKIKVEYKILKNI